MQYNTVQYNTIQYNTTIRLNRPEKYNAFDNAMYHEVADDLAEANEDDRTVVTAITGTGRYFSSGNDITAARDVTARTAAERTVRFVDLSLIHI